MSVLVISGGSGCLCPACNGFDDGMILFIGNRRRDWQAQDLVGCLFCLRKMDRRTEGGGLMESGRVEDGGIDPSAAK